MKIRNYQLFLTLALIISWLFLPTNNVKATTGGPTYISEIAFSTSSNSIFYIENDNSGRGCLPIIHKLDLTTLKNLELKTCTEIEQEFLNDKYEEGVQLNNQFISETFENLSYLHSVNLKKNNIKIIINFLSEYIEDGFAYWSEFSATIIQDNKEISKINFRGCTKAQPHIFEGYMVPNSDALAILISNKGDCFEGGYINESLHLIKNIKYYDTSVIRSFKDRAPSEPNLGNVVVYASLDSEINSERIENNATNKSENNYNWRKYYIHDLLLAIIVLILGFIIGIYFGKKSSTKK